MSLLGAPIRNRRYLLGADAPPVNPDALDDEFDDGSFSGWTWLDQGGTTASESDGALVLTLNENSNRMRGIYKTAPTAPWVFRAKVYNTNNTVLSGNQQAALFSAVGTTGEVRCSGFWGDEYWAITHTSPSSIASTWVRYTAPKDSNPPYAYFQLAWDGTDIEASYSLTGRGFTYLAQATPASAPTIVGLAITNATNREIDYRFGWFRRIL